MSPLQIYYWDVHNNFGDLINPWLWPKLMPEIDMEPLPKKEDGIVDAGDKDVLVGIGTLLNARFPKGRKLYVMGSGVGYGELPPLGDNTKIYCVRGPLSAKALDLPESYAAIDAGVLVNRFLPEAPSVKYKFSYMPQISSVVKCPGVWEKVCNELGFGYLDPTYSVDQTIQNIRETEVLLTESMHGAIIAEALRVPWIPIVTRQEILGFKWQDWCYSINEEYSPISVPPIYEKYKDSFLRNMKEKLSIQKAKSMLIKASKNKPTLGKESVLNSKSEYLLEKIELFREDYKNEPR